VIICAKTQLNIATSALYTLGGAIRNPATKK